MATLNTEKIPLVTCPYNQEHRMLQSRLQSHLAKCKLDHMDSKLKVCPFNATHLLEDSKFQSHILTCSDRGIIDKKMMETLDQSNEFKGRVAVPAYNSNRVIDHRTTENWDNEIGGIEAGFTPRDPAASNGLILDLGLTKPSERKKIYRRLATERDEETSVKPTKLPTPQDRNRQPKESHEMILRGQQNSGRGRGTPLTFSPQNSAAPAQSRKIAADIFNNDRQPKASYQEIISLNAGITGIGRGRGKLSYEQEFPSLGQR